jgi:protein-S-isoprenylcysteine O-methyltransferase Ste14
MRPVPAPPGDVGRLLGLAVFALLLLLAGTRLPAALRDLTQLQHGGLELLRALLIVGFYALLVFAYLRRGPARRTSTAVHDRIVAITTTFLPAVLPVGTVASSSPAMLATGSALACAGLSWSVWSLWHLRRSFSIVPQARDLVDTGPYRHVRHPLYAGELTALAGFVLAGPTVAAVTALVLLVGLQAYRATREESLLAVALPGYADYRLRTARLVPGVW